MLACAAWLIAIQPAVAQTLPDHGLRADGDPVALTFPALGRVIVTPLRSAWPGAAQCAVTLRAAQGRAARGRVQTIVTLGGADGGDRCWSTLAIGRVPAPAGGQRIAIIHIANAAADAPGAAAIPTPVILYRAGPAAGWTIDARLGRALESDGATETIAAIRDHVALFKD